MKNTIIDILKNDKIQKVVFIYSLAGSLLISSCDEVLNPEPIGVSSIDAQFDTPDRAVTVVNGMYDVLPSMFRSYTDYALIIEVWSDDLFLAGGGNDFEDGNVSPEQNIPGNMWNRLYTGIQRTNTVLDRIDGVDFSDNEALRDQFTGEAHFLRAFYYFHLVRLYGDVPLTLNEIVDVDDAKIAPSPTTEIYDQVISDLEAAITELPLNYSGNGLGQQVGRATSDAARGLLAYVHLTLENWQLAADLAGEVIGSSNNYTLLPNYADNFNGSNENSSESIFEIQYDGINKDFIYPFNLAPPNNIGVQILGGGGAGSITDTTLVTVREGNSAHTFIEAHETGDSRRDATIFQYGRDVSYWGVEVDGSPYIEWWVSKYISYSTANNASNFPFLRLADMHLIRAEALNELGTSISTAEADIDAIRARAGLDPINTIVNVNDQDEFREAIRHERRVETAFELKRFYDLNRWGIWQQRSEAQGIEIPQIVQNRIVNSPMTSKPMLLFPIPQDEINNNPNARQNTGY